MEDLKTENLQALLNGVELNDYQKVSANEEYKKLMYLLMKWKKKSKN